MLLGSVGEDLLRAVLQGAPPGTVYALVAIGFVLAYKTSGVFNLAFGAQAYVSAVVYFTAHVEWGWGALPSFLLAVVVIAPLLGVLLEYLVFRHLRTAPPVSGLVVAIGLTVALPALADVVLGFEPVGTRPEGVAPDGNSVFYDVFGVYSFSRNELVAMVAASIAVLGLAALFRFSVAGLRMRAVVESPRMTELNGIDANRVSAAAWALSSFFAGLAGVLIAPRFSTLSSGEFLNIVVIAIAAAAVGSLVSLPRAFAGGLGLGVLIAVFTTFVPKWAEDLSFLRPIQENVTPAIPFIVLLGILIFVPAIRRSQRASDPLSGVDPPPSSLVPVLEEDPRRALVRRVVAVAALLVVAGVVYTRADGVWTYLVTQAVTLAIVYLSFTVITGFAGHISLAQGAFAAIGGMTAFQLADRYEVSVLAGAVVGGLIAAVVGALLSLLIMRLNGIWIAIATLAFAFFYHSVIVKFSWAGGTADGSATQRVPRPVLGPWDFVDDRAFLVLAIVVLAVVAGGVTLFGRSDTGRVLRALRGSEVASQSIGISPAKGRVIAFGVASFVAAIGGAMVAMHQEAVSYDRNFAPLGAMFWLVLVVTFGVRKPMAAVLGAAAFSLMDKLVLQGEVFGWILRSPDRIPDLFPISPNWMMILFGLGTIQYAKHPEGVIDMNRAQIAARRAKRAARRRPGPPEADPPAPSDEPAKAEIEEPVA
ncbi:MAG TPA: ABC transporter permease [Acidimicrobiales bacterium]|nr:ABC transporter permease [Acidimicrobiales bacterium]